MICNKSYIEVLEDGSVFIPDELKTKYPTLNATIIDGHINISGICKTTFMQLETNNIFYSSKSTISYKYLYDGVDNDLVYQKHIGFNQIDDFMNNYPSQDVDTRYIDVPYRNILIGNFTCENNIQDKPYDDNMLFNLVWTVLYREYTRVEDITYLRYKPKNQIEAIYTIKLNEMSAVLIFGNNYNCTLSIKGLIYNINMYYDGFYWFGNAVSLVTRTRSYGMISKNLFIINQGLNGGNDTTFSVTTWIYANDNTSLDDISILADCLVKTQQNLISNPSEEWQFKIILGQFTLYFSSFMEQAIRISSELSSEDSPLSSTNKLMLIEALYAKLKEKNVFSGKQGLKVITENPALIPSSIHQDMTGLVKMFDIYSSVYIGSFSENYMNPNAYVTSSHAEIKELYDKGVKEIHTADISFIQNEIGETPITAMLDNSEYALPQLPMYIDPFIEWRIHHPFNKVIDTWNIPPEMFKFYRTASMGDYDMWMYEMLEDKSTVTNVPIFFGNYRLTPLTQDEILRGDFSNNNFVDWIKDFVTYNGKPLTQSRLVSLILRGNVESIEKRVPMHDNLFEGIKRKLRFGQRLLDSVIPVGYDNVRTTLNESNGGAYILSTINRLNDNSYFDQTTSDYNVPIISNDGRYYPISVSVDNDFDLIQEWHTCPDANGNTNMKASIIVPNGYRKQVLSNDGIQASFAISQIVSLGNIHCDGTSWDSEVWENHSFSYNALTKTYSDEVHSDIKDKPVVIQAEPYNPIPYPVILNDGTSMQSIVVKYNITSLGDGAFTIHYQAILTDEKNVEHDVTDNVRTLSLFDTFYDREQGDL